MIVRLTYILRRRWPILAVLLVVGAVAGLLIAPSTSSGVPTYESVAVVSASQAGANQTEVQQALVEARQGDVARTVAEELGDGTTAADVAGAIDAEFEMETFVATLRATAPEADEAEALARSFAEAFVAEGNGGADPAEEEALASAQAAADEAKRELQTFLTANAAALASEAPSPLLVSEQATLQSELDVANAALSDLRMTARPTQVYELVNVTGASLQAPSKLQVLDSGAFRAVLGLVLGAIAAALVILVAERTNPRIDDPEQAALLVGAPVLAMIPRLGRRRRSVIERVHRDDFKGPYAESFRTMRAHLEFRAAAEERTSHPRIMVTSATPSEGKSTTAAFLAMAFAEADTPPVVIGGDLRRPSIHRLFGVERIPGLTTRSLPGGTAVPLTSIVRRDAESGVTVVPSGPSVDSVTDILPDLSAITEVAQQSGQVVILDTAPVRVANDAVDFLSTVDWVVVVVQIGRSTKRSVSQMMHMLRMNGAQIVGVAMVGSVEAADASRDYYSYYAPEVRSRRDRKREQQRQAQADRPAGDGGSVAAAS